MQPLRAAYPHARRPAQDCRDSSAAKTAPGISTKPSARSNNASARDTGAGRARRCRRQPRKRSTARGDLRSTAALLVLRWALDAFDRDLPYGTLLRVEPEAELFLD